MKFESAISNFGAEAKRKLTNPSSTGEPEDQLRSPFERLIKDMADLSGFDPSHVTPIGETSLSDLKTRPDYSVVVQNALVGFVELKAPGKGANPNRFSDSHDKEQWQKLRSLPNLLYTDGNAFSLWRNGEIVDSVVILNGDIETSGDKLKAPQTLLALFNNFLRWKPIPPKTARELAQVSARLCRLLRDEVSEQLSRGSEALTALATDWRKLLFPDATNERFADGYAQAVTFGLLMARARKISLANGLHEAAEKLSETNSLIGTALRLLTDNAENQATLKTSLGTLTRVLEEVNWTKVSKGKQDAWLYFYEDFLEIYDNDLRKLTGSYYTPPQVVEAMVRLVDDLLRSPQFSKHAGLASPSVTVADPATGTGTFLLGILRRVAETVEEDEGKGSVPGAIHSAVKRLIAFEMQLGPFAVAQLRILAEVVELTGSGPKENLRMFVADTLENPAAEIEWIPETYKAFGKSRREAGKIKLEERVDVVIGNPPYKEKAKGRGGWIEGEHDEAEKSPPLAAWMPPAAWKVGAHSKHLRNLYVYFWRWATWKVFDQGPGEKNGIVCYITVAGFLGGPGFQKMRDYLRRTCDDIWVIDCSPDGHMPEVNTRIFQGVKQPVCIVLASRSEKSRSDLPAKVRFQALPIGKRDDKFAALGNIKLDGAGWLECPEDWRSPFLPASSGPWADFPALEDFFIYNGSGVMPGRTWVIAPDEETLQARWRELIHAPEEEKEKLFHPHLRGGKVGDKHSKKVVTNGLAGFASRKTAIADESHECDHPVSYGFRSFDRQWIIPDSRLINQPNPELWEVRSEKQIYLTAPSDRSPTKGPALTFTSAIPDLHHYNGRGGRTFPLWADSKAQVSNLRPKLLHFVSSRLGVPVDPEIMMAYIAGIAASPGFTTLFQKDLSTPGLRIPLTAEPTLFAEAAGLGQTIIWLHTFGERMAEPTANRPSAPPRIPAERRPQIPADGAIPPEVDEMRYDEASSRLILGTGYVENVPPTVWNYEVSGKQVLVQWFSYRRKNRERPIIGDRRPASPLCNIQPDHWLAEYTTELINVLNVLGMLVELEPKQASLLERICTSPLISVADMKAEGVLDLAPPTTRKSESDEHPELF
jgi:hypothetical protein